MGRGGVVEGIVLVRVGGRFELVGEGLIKLVLGCLILSRSFFGKKWRDIVFFFFLYRIENIV